MKNLTRFVPLVALAVISATLPPAASQTCNQDFDGSSSLPAGWVATNAAGSPPAWAISTTSPDTAPNCAFIPDASERSDKRLDTQPIFIGSAFPQIRFRNKYDFESDGIPPVYYDGGVLEASINGGPFVDITHPSVGGSWVSGGYNATIDDKYDNPIKTRAAWGGSTGGGYTDTVVNLGPNLNGQTIVLRFRMGTDQSKGAPGWRIDTLTVRCADSPQVGPDFVVTTTAAGGNGGCETDYCSLSDALDAANANADVSVITFQPVVTGRINQGTQNGLTVSTPVTIKGPGARILSVSGYGSTSNTRVFRVISPNVNISGLSITNGSASGSAFPDNVGGAIFNAGSLTLTDCILSGNSATSFGGCIYNNGSSGNASVTLQSCTLSGNSTPASGGAIFSAGYNGQATLNLTNCTLDQNSAGQAGGAIYNDGTSSGNAALTLTNCTLNKNSGGSFAGGIYNDARNPGSSGIATVILRNTIMRAGSSGVNLQNDSAVGGGGTITSQGHNLSSDAAGATGADAMTTGPAGFLNAAGDKRNTDPKLDTLKNDGGPTNTVALLSDSPGINTGDNAMAPVFDQRGYGRNGISDIGAFEFKGLLPVTLANISTRLLVETGDNVLIGGFIITGTQPKKVILRAIGPSLPFANKLANPTLELFGPSGLLDSNDNWVDSPNKQAIIDSTIPPGNDLESAIIATLPANGSGYTAIVRGVNNGTGIGVVEAYDLDRSVDSKLANIATRGLVQTGDTVLIAGTIVLGQLSQKVIIRAIGPSLSIAGKLGDPTLELRDANGGVIRANDNWRSGGQEAQIIQSTVPPTNDFESALVETLPGNGASYTAIVRGVSNTTGIAVVEVYALN